MGFNVQDIRADFPILHQEAYPGRPLIFLDSAASTQKPSKVIEAMANIMERDYANVHRGVHILSQRATDIFESCRAKVASFMSAEEREIVFTKNTTEAINLVANAWGRSKLKTGDQILITELEHHANIVPWQLICSETGADLVVTRIHDDGTIDLDDFRSKISSGKVKMFACAHVSNVLGTVLPLEILIPEAKAAGALTLVDGSQGITHRKVDVGTIGSDFYVW
ncbi:MAG: aminotransferase class V-fold PLP-dependent enzyme, partial [Alphaproteobacteria bacterium]